MAVLAPLLILTWTMLTWQPKSGATCYFFIFFYQKLALGGPKLLQLQNLGGGFEVFFLLRGPKSELRKS